MNKLEELTNNLILLTDTNEILWEQVDDHFQTEIDGTKIFARDFAIYIDNVRFREGNGCFLTRLKGSIYKQLTRRQNDVEVAAINALLDKIQKIKGDKNER